MLKIARLRIILVFVWTLFVLGSAKGQVNIGVLGGLNLSNSDGQSFRSSNRIGLQTGGFLTYHLTDYMALQGEPSFNIARLRSKGTGNDDLNGIQKGTKSLQYFNFPVLFKLKITPGFALLVGGEFNKLLNDEDYRLGNGGQAFKGGQRLGYSFGLELGKMYFRYRGLGKFTRVKENLNAQINQYQVGMRWSLL